LSENIDVPVKRDIPFFKNSNELLRMADYVLDAKHSRFTPELKRSIVDFHAAIIHERYELEQDETKKNRVA